MVLYYGLLALETANNTIAATAAATSTTAVPAIASNKTNLSRKQKYLSNSMGKMPSSSLSSSNSWIYTEDLRKRIDERCADYRYVFVPVYIDPKSTRRNHSTSAIVSQKIDRENSWIYSKSVRDRLYYSASKRSLPLTTNISSSAYCVTNQSFIRDELPAKTDLLTRLFKRSSAKKNKSTTSLSISSLPISPLTSSTSSFFGPNNLVKYRSNDVVEEEDDEGVDDENHSLPLIKQDSIVTPTLSTSRTSGVPLTDNDITTIHPIVTSNLTFSTSNLSNRKSTIKRTISYNSKLTRLRSFFFKTSSPSTSSFSRIQQQQQQQQQTILPSSSLPNRIAKP